MLVRTLFIVAFATITMATSPSVGEEEKMVPGVVCFAVGKVKGDNESWQTFRFRAEGICLSHAKGFALESCYAATNRPRCTVSDDECYVTTIKKPKAK